MLLGRYEECYDDTVMLLGRYKECYDDTVMLLRRYEECYDDTIMLLRRYEECYDDTVMLLHRYEECYYDTVMLLRRYEECLPSKAQLDQFLVEWNESYTDLANRYPSVFCHMDVHTENVICDSKTGQIWTYLLLVLIVYTLSMRIYNHLSKQSASWG